MSYCEVRPPPAWRLTLSCLWLRTVQPGDPPLRILPDAGIDVIWAAGHGVFIAGPDTKAKIARPPAGTMLAGIRLRPGAAGAALGLPMSELRDLRVAVEDVDARLAVDPSLTPGEALEALLAAIGPVRPDSAVLAAARSVRSVATAARDVGLSERQLRRRSLDAMGYGPQTLGRILRFQRFVRLADVAPDRSLAELALDAGYADQSHLTRECTHLAGVPPAVLRRERTPGWAATLDGLI